MAETGTLPIPAEDDQALRRQLIVRVAVAGGIVVALLGGLVLVDYFGAGDEHGRQQLAMAPAPQGQAPVEVAKPAEPPRPAETTTSAEPAEPERSAQPAVDMKVARTERPLTEPAVARLAVMAPPPAALPPAPGPAPAGQPPMTTRPAAAATAQPFLVQVGVFNNVGNAEELRARLDAAGIPAQIEARVQVGPFATRQEAERAREKLKALGIEPGLLIAARK